jgi:hypothetical protein
MESKLSGASEGWGWAGVADGGVSGSENLQSQQAGGLGDLGSQLRPSWAAAGEKHCPISHGGNIGANWIRPNTLGLEPHLSFFIYFFLQTQPKGKGKREGT